MRTPVGTQERPLEIPIRDVYSIPGLVENNHVFGCRVASTQKLKMQEGAGMKWLKIEDVEKLNLGYQQKIFLPKLIEFMQAQ